jgi:hypothetical protein
MKRLITAAFLLSLCAGAAWSHDISIYADQLASECALRNLVPPPGQNSVYLVHKFNPGSTASQLKVNDTSGLFAASQTTPYLSLGTWNTDLSFAYGGCVIGQHVLMTLNFFWFGQAMTCGNYLETTFAPTSPIPGEIAIVDCTEPAANLLPASGGRIFFGPQGDQCPGINCGVNAASEATWGSVKALYR